MGSAGGAGGSDDDGGVVVLVGDNGNTEYIDRTFSYI